MRQEETIHLIQETDHQQRAVDRLIRPFKDKPRIEAFLRACTLGVQIQEEDTFGTIVGTTLELATDDALNKWGIIVGEPRGGLTDEDYRRFIEGRILANICESTADEFIRILQTITGVPQGDVQLRYLYPAGFQMWFIHDAFYNDTLKNRVGRFMRDIKPAGISMLITEGISGTKAFDSDGFIYAPFDRGVFGRTI